MSYQCKILADSVGPSGVRIVTFEVTFPRFILAEVNTHRALSRSSASSRAIPVEKRIAAVLEDPFIPVHWGVNQRGMRATQELTGSDQELARRIWLDGRDAAVQYTRQLLELGVHKQITNRLLEPYQWHTALVTATELQNFFNLRCHPDAQPEFRVIAEMMRDAYHTQRPTFVEDNSWHLPLVPDIEQLRAEGHSEMTIARISCARCARVSYLTHDGKRDPRADLELAKRLQSSGHMSPFEHAAMALRDDRRVANFRGWESYRRGIPGEAVFRPAAGA